MLSIDMVSQHAAYEVPQSECLHHQRCSGEADYRDLPFEEFGSAVNWPIGIPGAVVPGHITLWAPEPETRAIIRAGGAWAGLFRAPSFQPWPREEIFGWEKQCNNICCPVCVFVNTL